ncbi:PREDICTED: nuclear RNA export factor 1-like isoform X2 [Branchiostoma belcheri]|uniref:Nuclear RNA export factor 1-like isoform X2 n=1 Tax=Branchiostoma belcheri TaxID=7741 RepID=A0A6P5ADU7_BRABE|nr:PREDICTED: nuclear RNA export factor 1-like isoform X2 [Branchiostoma belcheri]
MAHKGLFGRALEDTFKVTTSRDGSRSFFGHDDRTSSGSRDRSGGFGFNRDRGGGGGGSWRGGYDQNRDGGYRSRGRGGQSRGSSRNRYRGNRRGGWKRGGRGGEGGGPTPRSRFEDDEGDIQMSDDGSESQQSQRYNPYGRPESRRSNRPNHSGRGRRGGGGRGGYRDLDAPSTSHSNRAEGGDEDGWHKITVLQGKRNDKNWLLNTLQKMCPVPFQPTEYRFDKNNVVFYVPDKATADGLTGISRKIKTREGIKLVVLSRPETPESIRLVNKTTMEAIKLCMAKRFDATTSALNLSNLFGDIELQAQDIRVALSRKMYMNSVIAIIKENVPVIEHLDMSNNRLFHLGDLADLVSVRKGVKYLNLSHNELKSEFELDKIKDWKLDELWLDGNPVCNHFKEQSAYISAVRKRFPKVARLDGHELPPPIAFDLESNTALPETKGSNFDNNDMCRKIIMDFLEKYFIVYDSEDRQGLLEAYHDQAYFSLCVFSPLNAPHYQRKSLQDFSRDSRNLLFVRDLSQRVKYLKHSRLNVVAFLNELPHTQHDPNSFVIDVGVAMNSLMCFTVSGLFREVVSKSGGNPPIRSFSRVFTAVPAAQGLCIVNDMMTISAASPTQEKAAFASPAPTPSPSPVPGPSGLSEPQQQMVKMFAEQSGMNEEWSQSCLEQNGWEYNKSAQVFTELKGQNKIPPEAFLK